MIATVVLTLDGSAGSETALPYARALCASTGAALVLASVVSTRSGPSFWPGLTTRGADRAAIEQRIDERRRYLERVRAAIDGVAVRTELGAGHPAREIVAITRRIDRPLLVTACRDAGDADDGLAEDTIAAIKRAGLSGLDRPAGRDGG